MRATPLFNAMAVGVLVCAMLPRAWIFVLMAVGLTEMYLNRVDSTTKGGKHG